MKNAAILLLLQLTAIAVYAQRPAPRLPPPAAGMGTYLMVLWPPGSPIPGDPTRSVKDHPEPDVTKHGGKVLFKNDHRRFITLPFAAANELRKDEAVVYLQRIWMGESLAGWDERYVAPRTEFTSEAQDDTNLLWGPKAYAYDGSGNIKQIGTDQYDQYTYDSAGRLIQSTVGGKTESFKYDSFGNLIEKQVSGANATTIAVDGSSNRMLGVTYDAAGNALTAQEGLRTYEFDSFNMMTRVRSTAGGDRRMVYDANDERIGMVKVYDSLSRWTIRDFEGRVVREYEADSLTLWFWEQDEFYGEGSLLGGETQEWGYTSTYRYGGKRHYHLDHLGSVRVVTDKAGRSLSEHDYYPFGTTMTRTYQEQLNYADPHIDAMRFAGHWRDFLGLLNTDNTEYVDYMHARYYDPNLGRFLSVDQNLNIERAKGEPQLWNRYSYVGNNPMKYIDPNGEDRWDTVNGYFNALFSDFLLPVPRRTGNADFQVGQFNADRAAAASGGILTLAGGTTAVVGSETGVLIAVGVGVASYGTAVAANAGIHLAQDNNPRSGGGSEDRNPAQDKRLSNGEVKQLEKAGHDIHELKGGKNASKYDLFKDKNGNVYIKPKNGKGPGDPTGINLNDLR